MTIASEALMERAARELTNNLFNEIQEIVENHERNYETTDVREEASKQYVEGLINKIKTRYNGYCQSKAYRP